MSNDSKGIGAGVMEISAEASIGGAGVGAGIGAGIGAGVTVTSETGSAAACTVRPSTPERT
jgi:hypothetical protein